MTAAYDIATATVVSLMAGNEFAVAAFVHPQLHKLGTAPTHKQPPRWLGYSVKPCLSGTASHLS